MIPDTETVRKRCQFAEVIAPREDTRVVTIAISENERPVSVQVFRSPPMDILTAIKNALPIVGCVNKEAWNGSPVGSMVALHANKMRDDRWMIAIAPVETVKRPLQWGVADFSILNDWEAVNKKDLTDAARSRPENNLPRGSGLV